MNRRTTMTIFTKGTAVITGASAGIGAIYADRLARRGYDLILVARNQQKLDALAGKLADATGRSVKTVEADLNNKLDLSRIESLLRTDGSITMLVNNAGVGAVAPLVESDRDAMEQMIDLNVTARTRHTHAVVPALVKRGGGAIINISSAVAIGPEILNGVYGATKAFVLAFSQSLHKELADDNVQIQVVLPGAVSTAFWDTAGGSIQRSLALTMVSSSRSRHFRTRPIGTPMKRLDRRSSRTFHLAFRRNDITSPPWFKPSGTRRFLVANRGALNVPVKLTDIQARFVLRSL
jgi:short-subunit dehydrogenase